MAATMLVGDVAEKLAPHGISVIPVKGALLQHWLYADPSERTMTDVDLLVLPEDLQRAVTLLERAGYQKTRHQSIGGVVMETPFGIALDLHPELFDRTRYRMPSREVFARSTENQSLFGSVVRLPAAVDVYAHLIGKAASDHVDARTPGRLDEIRRLGAALEASAEEVSWHLVACGMGRASRYVLPLVHRFTGDPFAMRVHAALPRDPLGRGIAAIAARVFAATSPTSDASAVLAHLLNDSIPRALISGLRGLRDRPRT
jgi:hypothetical protein